MQPLTFRIVPDTVRCKTRTVRTSHNQQDINSQVHLNLTAFLHLSGPSAGRSPLPVVQIASRLGPERLVGITFPLSACPVNDLGRRTRNRMKALNALLMLGMLKKQLPARVSLSRELFARCSGSRALCHRLAKLRNARIMISYVARSRIVQDDNTCDSIPL